MRGDLVIDHRGTVSFVNDFKFEDVKRFYVVSNHEVRAARGWHGHKKEAKYVYVVEGVAAIGYVPLGGKKPEWVIMSAQKPQVLYIPPGYANAGVTLTFGAKIMYFSTATLEDSKKDDLRFPIDKWPIWGYAK